MICIPRRGVLAGLALALTLAGCGGGSPSSSSASGAASGPADPANAIPASALLYVQAVVRPRDSLASGIDAGAKKLVGIANPGTMIDAAIDAAIKQPNVSYEATIRPWLGERAAIALLGGSPAKPQFAVVADQTNALLARKTLFGLVRSAPANGSAGAVVAGTYRSVAYLAKADGSAAVAVAGPFAIVASLSGLRRVVDVEQGAAALSTAPEYQAAATHSVSAAVVTMFLRTRQLINVFAASSGSGAAAAGSSALLDQLIPANSVIFASGRLDANGLTIDIAVPKGGVTDQIGPSDLFASLPAGSWLALGEGGVGAALAKLVGLATRIGGVSSSGSCTSPSVGKSTCTSTTSTSAVSSATAAILAAYTKILRQISDLAVFVKGTQLASIEGGLEIRTTSPAAAATLFGQLKGVLGGLNSTQVVIGPLGAPGIDRGFTATVQGLPFVIDVAEKGRLLVGAVGSGALADALSTSNRLGDSVTGKLLGSGVRPVLAISLPAVATLVQGLGATSNPTVAQIIRYLKSLGTLAAGQSLSGGYAVERIAIG